jgi:hypothetical protein
VLAQVRRGVLTAIAFMLVALVGGAGAASTTTSHAFQTGFLDEAIFESTPGLGFKRAAEAGATVERLRLHWDRVAPTRPAVATDPLDPAYDWSSFDAQVDAAAANGQQPIANVFYPPPWALTSAGQGFPNDIPDPAALAAFLTAAATRYDGHHGKPWVKYWEIWNEPNLGLYVEPQLLPGGEPFAAEWYRNVLNAVTPAIKSVDPDDVVIAGSTAPFYDTTASTVAVDPRWGPLSFMRAVLCLTPQLTSTTPSCTVAFDAWAHHPYTEGGPSHTATYVDDVSLGDLPRMKALLDAAWSLGHVDAPSSPELWVTEFSWDSDPPDSNGVPMSLLERWIPEGMYQMWSAGVTVLTWFQLVDMSPVAFQTGLYTTPTALSADEPKPILEAFRFPFVAYRSAGGIFYWGRTPAGTAGNVTVQQADGNGGWTALGTTASDQYGILRGRFATSSDLPVRAVLTGTGEAGLPFSLRTVPDRYFPSFGQWQFEPSKTYGPRPTIPAHWKP